MIKDTHPATFQEKLDQKLAELDAVNAALRAAAADPTWLNRGSPEYKVARELRDKLENAIWGLKNAWDS